MAKLNRDPKNYGWAENPLKLQRAIAKATEQVNTVGGELTEDLVQEWYVKLGGRVISTARKTRNAQDSTETV